MLLTAKEITAISAGTVRTENEWGGLALHRFTERQTEVFFRPDPLYTEPYFTEQYKGYFGHNCRTCAGVCLDFYTDSRRFRLEIGENEVPNDASEGLSELYINGKPRLFAPASAGFDAVLGAGTKRVTVWLPFFNFPLISAAEIDDGAAVYDAATDSIISEPARKVKVVSTVGAADREALVKAVEYSSEIVQIEEAIPPRAAE